MVVREIAATVAKLHAAERGPRRAGPLKRVLGNNTEQSSGAAKIEKGSTFECEERGAV